MTDFLTSTDALALALWAALLTRGVVALLDGVE